MGEDYELLETFGGSDVVGHVDATMKSVANYANNLQDSLDGLRDNTKSLYWWTSTLVCITLGLFLLAQLVRLRHELQTVNQYQELFLRMWEDDRRTEQARIEEERRARAEQEKRTKQLEDYNRKARAAARAARGDRETTGGTAAQNRSSSSSNVNNVPGGVSSDRGTFSSGTDYAQDVPPPPGPAKPQTGTNPTSFRSSVYGSPWRRPAQQRGAPDPSAKTASGLAPPSGSAQPGSGLFGANQSTFGKGSSQFGSGVSSGWNSTAPTNPYAGASSAWDLPPPRPV
ncbi:hypothetical protein Hte_003146 [Hypoxylon texense]